MAKRRINTGTTIAIRGPGAMAAFAALTGTQAAPEFVEVVWAVVDDSEEDAQSGDVTIDAANWTRLLRALWDLGGKHRERLKNLGWTPPELNTVR